MSNAYRKQVLEMCETLKQIAATYKSIAEDATILANKYKEMADSDDADEQVALAKEVVILSKQLDVKFDAFERSNRVN